MLLEQKAWKPQEELGLYQSPHRKGSYRLAPSLSNSTLGMGYLQSVDNKYVAKDNSTMDKRKNKGNRIWDGGTCLGKTSAIVHGQRSPYSEYLLVSGIRIVDLWTQLRHTGLSCSDSFPNGHGSPFSPNQRSCRSV